jgi:CO/xanthine dehydrogenase Mo-binding subunit
MNTTQLVRGRIGEIVERPDGRPKVTGEFAYSSDLSAPGMLHGATLRSPHAHARILSIDTTAALLMPGVHAVLTHADVPGAATYGLEFADQPVLAIDRVRYHGEPVAIVAAQSLEEARAATRAIPVVYEPLPAVDDMQTATSMPPIHDGRPTSGHGYRDDPRPNVVRSVVIRHGDPGVTGDVVVTGEYEVGIQDQAFLGPESGLAVPDGEGGIDIYVATQWLHVDRDQVAPCLALAPEQVRIHLAGVGGAFGGREDLSMQIHGALLALHTKRAVRVVYGRAESFVGHVHRHPARMRFEHRATREGRITSVHCQILLDGGAYASSSSAVVSNACSFALGPYDIPNALLEGTVVYTNNPPCGAMRGFGAVQTCFGSEAQMDRLADALGMDPVELRLRNALVPGSVLPTGQRITGSLPVAEVIRQAAALLEPEAERTPRDPRRLPGGTGDTTRGEGVRRGVGFAVGYKNICFSEGFDDSCAARVVLRPDGSATLHCAAAEVGQGVGSVLLQVARTELQSEDVTLASHTTATVGSAGSASASRMTWMATAAVRDACRAALEQRAEGTAGGDIDIERVFRHARTTPLDPETGQITGERAHVAFAVCAMRVVAEVDEDLGLCRVVWIGAAQDVGRALNPQAVIGQIEGGTAQGLGLALMEELLTRDGRIVNPTFTDYLLPTALDMPPLDIALVEDPDPEQPYGAKGVGEPPTVVATAAIVAALRAASGRPLTRAPVRPDDIALG